MLHRTKFERGDCGAACSPAPVQCRHAASIDIRTNAAKILFIEATRGSRPSSAAPLKQERHSRTFHCSHDCTYERVVVRSVVYGRPKYTRGRACRAAVRFGQIQGAQPAVAADARRGGTFHTTPHVAPTRRPRHCAQPCVYGVPTRRSYRSVRVRSQNLILRGDVPPPSQPPQPLQPVRERLANVDPRFVSATVLNCTRRRAWTVCVQ